MMRKRPPYAKRPRLIRLDVVYRKRFDSWVVVSRLWSSGCYRFRSKAAAIQVARNESSRALARGRKGITVRIHKKNGRIAEERTYPRSADPKRSKG